MPLPTLTALDRSILAMGAVPLVVDRLDMDLIQGFVEQLLIQGVSDAEIADFIGQLADDAIDFTEIDLSKIPALNVPVLRFGVEIVGTLLEEHDDEIFEAAAYAVIVAVKAQLRKPGRMMDRAAKLEAEAAELEAKGRSRKAERKLDRARTIRARVPSGFASATLRGDAQKRDVLVRHGDRL